MPTSRRYFFDKDLIVVNDSLLSSSNEADCSLSQSRSIYYLFKIIQN